jgi:hypothetical protein
MAKKTLTEAVVRRFQKLANVAPMNEMYNSNENYMKEEEEEEEEVDADPEMDATAELPVDDAPAEIEMDAEEVPMDGDLELTDEEAQAIIDLGAKLEAALGGMGDDMDADPEMAADEMGADDMDAEEELMEALRGINYTPSRKEVVNEVAKRVAKRLKTAKLHESKLNRALGRKGR